MKPHNNDNNKNIIMVNNNVILILTGINGLLKYIPYPPGFELICVQNFYQSYFADNLYKHQSHWY